MFAFLQTDHVFKVQLNEIDFLKPDNQLHVPYEDLCIGFATKHLGK